MGTTESEASNSGQAVRKHAYLSEALASEIASGTYPAQSFLPSEPALARLFSLSRSTVRKALSSLEQKGLVERMPGKGTVVIDRAQDRIRTALAAFAIVLPEIQAGYYPALVEAFAAAASESHHQVLVCTTRNGVRQLGDVVLQLLDSRVAGVAVHPSSDGYSPEYHFRQLHRQGIPVVILHRPVSSFAAPVIAMPYEEIAAMAARYLIDQRHRRIAFVASHRSQVVERYLASLQIQLKAVNCDLPEDFVHIGDSGSIDGSSFRMHEIKIAMEKLMAIPRRRRPTAIINPWDSDMEACRFALSCAGIETPKQMSLVSFGSAARSTALAKPLTSVVVDEQLTANMAIDLLNEMCRGERSLTDTTQFSVPISFHIGETVLPPS